MRMRSTRFAFASRTGTHTSTHTGTRLRTQAFQIAQGWRGWLGWDLDGMAHPAQSGCVALRRPDVAPPKRAGAAFIGESTAD